MQFCRLLNPSPSLSLSIPDLGSCSIAQFGNHLALTSLVHSKEPWIIDLDASDRMTGGSHFFLFYISCPSSIKIKIADGSLSSVTGIGSIRVFKHLILHSILHVPTLKCNLLSISKITRDNNCVANFHSSMCQFQDLSIGRTIGNSRIHEGLYYLENTHYEGRQAFASRVTSVSVFSAKEIMLWHHWLSHPNFCILKNICYLRCLNMKILFLSLVIYANLQNIKYHFLQNSIHPQCLLP